MVDSATSGKISDDVASKLSKGLESRVDRDVLVHRAILRDPENVGKTIHDRGSRLDGLLRNRPTRDRLERMNVIKEDENVAPALSAARDQLKRQQDKDKLETFIAHRPEQGSLKDRRIIIDEVDATSGNVRDHLEKHIGHRPNMESLVERNILRAPVSPGQESPDAYVLEPTMVTAFEGIKVVDVGVGWAYSCALDDKGRVYTFGSNDNGRLGQGASGVSGAPPTAIIVPLQDVKVVSLSTGLNHAAAVSARGDLYLWGEGQWGRLGLGDSEDQATPHAINIESFDGAAVVAVSCGAYHTLVATDTDRVFAFGWNKFGRLGVGDTTVLKMESPIEIKSLGGKKVKAVCAGWGTSAAITGDGELYTWGCGTFGMLAHGDEENQWEPRPVAALASTPIRQVSLGEYHMVCVGESGELWSCGRNDYHQLGSGDVSVSLPLRLTMAEQIVHAAAGKNYSLAATTSGALMSWGRGSSGVLGCGDQSGREIPTTARSGGVIVVAAAVAHSAFATRSGELFMFGSRGANGQLGGL